MDRTKASEIYKILSFYAQKQIEECISKENLNNSNFSTKKVTSPTSQVLSLSQLLLETTANSSKRFYF